MKAVTKKAESNLVKLSRVAGGRQYVVRALKELGDANIDPTMGQLLDYILERRTSWWNEPASGGGAARGAKAGAMVAKTK